MIWCVTLRDPNCNVQRHTVCAADRVDAWKIAISLFAVYGVAVICVDPG